MGRTSVVPAKAEIHGFLVLLIAVAAGCAERPASPARGLEGRIWDTRAERFVSEDDLVRRLREVRFRLLGEVHDHPAHHRHRAALIRELGAPGEIYFEQFDRDHDAGLREAQRAGAGAAADALARAGLLDAAWQWPLHRPLVEAALAAPVQVRAANLSASDARRIARAGKLGPQDAALAGALANADWPAARESALREAIFESHCRVLPEKSVPAMALAQRARDATIAIALAGAAGSAVLIAGNGHVRRDLGVPLYLPHGATFLSVGFLETQPGEADPRDYALGANRVAKYDYIWFTAPQPRPDPCEKLRKRPAN
ncbi:MAG: hypothetical protein EXR33_00080 [Betaproteobacteria bacterium]|nr:hypothetical protein [Betaproteobacteria bacterium]